MKRRISSKLHILIILLPLTLLPANLFASEIGFTESSSFPVLKEIVDELQNRIEQRKLALIKWMEGTKSTGKKERHPLTASAFVQDITPPVGCPLAGFGGGSRRLPFPDFNPNNYVVLFTPSKGIHDPIRVKGVILDNGERKIAIVGTDAVGATEFMILEIAKRIASTGITFNDIIFTGTHTHSGPGDLAEKAIWWFIATDFFDQRIFDFVAGKIAEAMIEADKNLVPAKMGIASEPFVGIQENRRGHPDRFDPELGVIRIDRTDGTPLATIFNFAIHPTCLGASNLYFTADLPGYAERYLEANLNNSVAIFINGAEGDVRPIKGGFDGAQLLGETLGQEVLSIREQIQTSENIELQMHTLRFDLPDARLQVNACDEEWLGWLPEWLVLDLNNYTDRTAVITALRLNNDVFVTVPGEPLTNVGKAIKDKRESFGLDHLFVFGLGNGHISYIVPADEFPEGGYEVCGCLYGPELAGEIVKYASQAIQQVLPTSTPTTTPTCTPSSTPAPTLEPSSTATPSPSPTSTLTNKTPIILIGGYWDTRITYKEGGYLNLLCLVSDEDDEHPLSVKIYYHSIPIGIDLPVYDEQSGLYWLRDIFILRGNNPQEILLEIIAFDGQNCPSFSWPYLNCH